MEVFKIAHDLGDRTKIRSRDVALAEDVNFQDLLLQPATLVGLRECGFEQPSPVQLAAIPLGRCGFDLVVQSKAGTGKTCIFALIALEALHSNTNGYTQTLIVAPTREIAIQIHEVVSQIGRSYEKLSCALCIGGIEVKQDRKQLKQKLTGTSQVVVGTPGRLRQLIELNILQTQQVELLVLDEADKLMDDQFKAQIDEIYKRLPEDKQMIATSATYPNELAPFLQRYMRSPKSVRLGAELSLDAIEEFYVDCKAGHSGKKTLEAKLETLKRLLMELSFQKCFVFTNFQARAPQICDHLNRDEQFLVEFGTTGYICAELTQERRNQIFTDFKRSRQRLLVSTDVSARGIDIQDIELVINLDLPADRPTYYHRIGRAGRFGQAGKAISIVSSECVDQSLFRKSVKSDKLNKLPNFDASSSFP